MAQTNRETKAMAPAPPDKTLRKRIVMHRRSPSPETLEKIIQANRRESKQGSYRGKWDMLNAMCTFINKEARFRHYDRGRSGLPDYWSYRRTTNHWHIYLNNKEFAVFTNCDACIRELERIAFENYSLKRKDAPYQTTLTLRRKKPAPGPGPGQAG